jgi:hypothetical protein
MSDPRLYSPDIKFETQLNYTNAIMTKIQELQFSLRMGKDCTREFSNIIALLTDGIKEPIKPKLKEIAERYESRIKEIRNIKDFPETTFQWSGRHKIRYIGVLVKREQSDAILEMIPVIINRLDEMNLLLNREKKTQI